MTQEMALRESRILSVEAQETVRQKTVMQEILKNVMKPKVHYDTIPGTDKPTLLKPGVEIISLTFRLSIEHAITMTPMDKGHREYSILSTVKHIPTQEVFAEGVGLCTMMESKFRYRHSDAVDTGQMAPKVYWDKKNAGDLMGANATIGKGNTVRKNPDGQWTIHKRGEGRMENPDIADVYNTVLKMAKKRADVDGILSATAASDIFTQDVEDLSNLGPNPPPSQERKWGDKEKEPSILDWYRENAEKARAAGEYTGFWDRKKDEIQDKCKGRQWGAIMKIHEAIMAKGTAEPPEVDGVPPSQPDPGASPLIDLPESHNTLIAKGGGYASAFRELEKAHSNLTSSNPKLVTDCWEWGAKNWGAVPETDDMELKAIGTLKGYFFAKAEADGFPQE